MAKRRSARRSPSWLTGLVLGVALGAGLVLAGMWGFRHGMLAPQHTAISSHPVRHPAVPRPHRANPALPPRPEVSQAPAPAAPAPAPQHTAETPQTPAAPAAPVPLPRQNPEASEAPAIEPGPPAPHEPETPGRSPHARVAIIFDDAGYSILTAREVEALGRPVTMSVLPHLPFSTPIAQEAPAHGVEIILHLPVQPEDPTIPLGPGVITVEMGDQAIRNTVAGDLDTVPNAIGANNHEGSRGTADPRVMHDVISIIQARHLFFIDSMTSPRSVGAVIARQMGVPTAARAVFLDNDNTDASVRAQFHALIQIALARGQAIAIGHVGKVTAAVLRSMYSEFDEAGIQLVGVSQLVQ
ncbi:MAG TPA: divergent polysaccharide deacetylase family protein [bacterium]|nr:divergent polysaccharide deacetylase family protein [bacterium]